MLLSLGILLLFFSKLHSGHGLVLSLLCSLHLRFLHTQYSVTYCLCFLCWPILLFEKTISIELVLRLLGAAPLPGSLHTPWAVNTLVSCQHWEDGDTVVTHDNCLSRSLWSIRRRVQYSLYFIEIFTVLTTIIIIWSEYQTAKIILRMSCLHFGTVHEPGTKLET